MLKLTFTNAEVVDNGYGPMVNGYALSDIISTALGTKVGINVNSIVFLNIFGQTQFVLILNVHELLLALLIIYVYFKLS